MSSAQSVLDYEFFVVAPRQASERALARLARIDLAPAATALGSQGAAQHGLTVLIHDYEMRFKLVADTQFGFREGCPAPRPELVDPDTLSPTTLGPGAPHVNVVLSDGVDGLPAWQQEYLEKQVRTSKHAPFAIRNTVPLQNSPEFAEEFSCPAGSDMNPAERCRIWSFYADATTTTAFVSVARSSSRLPAGAALLAWLLGAATF